VTDRRDVSMIRAIAPLAASLVMATLMSACRPQHLAPNEELRALTGSLRANGVTLRVPANLREERVPEDGAFHESLYLSWAGSRVWVAIDACVGVADPGSCTIGEKGFVERPPVRLDSAEIRRFESLKANQPREVVWVTPDGASGRTVVLIIGRTAGDSVLVRLMAETVRPSPE
jgi:hypothetical protein